MFKKSILALLVVAFLLFVVGCESMTTTVEKPVLKPTFDTSHAILIEKAINGLDVVKAVKDYVDQKEKLIVVSIETTTTHDYPVNYVIEDNLIAKLVGANYSVLERDENLLARMMYEQGDRYQRVIPDAPSSILLKGIEGSGMRFLNPNPDAGGDVNGAGQVNLKDSMDFFQKLNDFYRDMLGQVKVKNADVLVSYRVLECGIMVEKEEPQQGVADPNGKTADTGTATNLLKVFFKREAMARLAIRVVDAKTGEVRYAGILENRSKDSLPFEQEEGQTEEQFRSNVEQYQEYLKDYHYTFYDQQLPNMRGTKTDQQEIVSQTQKTQTTSTEPQK